jgi:hypothetical protein
MPPKPFFISNSSFLFFLTMLPLDPEPKADHVSPNQFRPLQIDMDHPVGVRGDSGLLALESAILPAQRWHNIAKHNFYLADMTRIPTSNFSSFLV